MCKCKSILGSFCTIKFYFLPFYFFKPSNIRQHKLHWFSPIIILPSESLILFLEMLLPARIRNRSRMWINAKTLPHPIYLCLSLSKRWELLANYPIDRNLQKRTRKNKITYLQCKALDQFIVLFLLYWLLNRSNSISELYGAETANSNYRMSHKPSNVYSFF